MSPVSRQPAGKRGPLSLRSLRDDEVARGSKVIRATCRNLLLEGRKPSITTVADASGMSVSSVNREPYKGILRAGRACHPLMAAGLTYDAAVAIVGEYIDPPVKDKAPQEANSRNGPVRIAKLEVELARRDDQLYYTLGLVHELRALVRWHREKLRDLTLQLGGLTEEPWPARSPRIWQEDLENVAVGEIYDDDDGDSAEEDEIDQ